MLVLTRKVGESINIGDHIVVKIVEIGKNKIRIGIEAPEHVSVLRNEIYEKIQQENIRSAEGSTDDIIEAAKLWKRVRRSGTGKQ